MSRQIKPGLIQVYTGNSKGKTTAALGQGFRAIGHGLSVGMIQFMKGTTYTGEIYAAERLYPYFQIFSYGRGCRKAALIKSGESMCDSCMECFVMPDQILESDREDARKALACFKGMLVSQTFDIVILDEISGPLQLGLVTEDDLKALLLSKPDHMEIIMTGRNMPGWVIILADLVTEMVQIKHPYEKGIPGRWGIEY
jgi:cob(I)alamin adenosyltransferase